MRWMIKALAAIGIGLFAATTISAAQDRDPRGFPQSGYINNGVGDKCGYSQIYEQTNPHFMPSGMKSTTHQEVRTIRFIDPDCMANSIKGADFYEPINMMMINNIVTGWFLGTYVIRDANFDTRNLHQPGKYQARGQCIQSKAYPSKAIAIEYFSDGDSITSVAYMLALGGCGERI